MYNNDAEKIIDYVTSEIEILTRELDNYDVSGENNTEIAARISALENVRSFIAVNFL